MVIAITGFFEHLTPFLHHLIHAHIITCTRVHHPHGWFCTFNYQPGGPNLP